MTVEPNGEQPSTAPEIAVDAATLALPPHRPGATAGAPQPCDEAAMRSLFGLPADAMILTPPFTPVPLRLPDQVWAMQVVAVDVFGAVDADRVGEAELFAGRWVHDQPPHDLYDGDVVVRLTRPADPTYPLLRDYAVDVEMLMAYHDRWQRVGQWRGVDHHWPKLVAPTAAAVMFLHTDLVKSLTHPQIAPHECTHRNSPQPTATTTPARHSTQDLPRSVSTVARQVRPTQGEDVR